MPHSPKILKWPLTPAPAIDPNVVGHTWLEMAYARFMVKLANERIRKGEQ